MKSIKIYNMIFPIWLLIFIPPIILGVMAINFIIDSIVILICFYVYRSSIKDNIFKLYKKSILKVWLIGFLADFVGATLLLSIALITDRFEITSGISSALMFDPFTNIMALFIVLISILLSSYFIYKWNYKRIFSKSLDNVIIQVRVSLVLAIVTAPWTFFLPTELIYHY